MKRLAFWMLASLLCFGTVACDDSNDDGEKGQNNGGNGSNGGNGGNGGGGGAAYDVSAESACKYILDTSNAVIEHLAFNPDEASDAQYKVALELCVEEMNGLPSCKDEFIKAYSCEYALQTGKVTSTIPPEWSDCGVEMDKKFEACVLDLLAELCSCNLDDDAFYECIGRCSGNKQDIHRMIVALDPCYDASADVCWNALNDNAEAYQAFEKYISDYEKRYEEI